MSFIIDKQTLDDLNIFGKHKGESIYTIFNSTHTRGGAKLLEEMFSYPLSDPEKINLRSNTIRYFQEKKVKFPFRSELFDAAEHYLSNTDSRSLLHIEDNTLQRKVKNYIGADTEFQQIQKGITAMLEIIHTLSGFLEEQTTLDTSPYAITKAEIRKLLHQDLLIPLLQQKLNLKLSYQELAVYDKLFRHSCHDLMKQLLYQIYTLDVFISVAEVAVRRNFSFAEAIPFKEQNILSIKGLYHPQLKNPLANDIEIDDRNNIIFLTGANMAGKSTFMKSLGVAVFLAHTGFPVPAREMKFTTREGMFTTINLPDNLNMGYSHFYAEVLRVKKVAENIRQSHNLLIIFDELFRGTNVKDAFDATVAITEKLSAISGCIFVVSTHIIEAGEILKEKCKNIHFIYLPTIMKDNRPTYTYQLTPGITNDRHGMMIIRNEKILDILDK